MEALPSISEYHSSPAMTYCFLAKQWENVWPIIEFLIVFLLAMENLQRPRILEKPSKRRLSSLDL